MKFTKPKSSVKPIDVEVLGASLLVLNCESHPENEAIKISLMTDKWNVSDHYLGYRVEGFTQTDRNLLRDELIKAYQGTLEDADDPAMINAIVKEIVVAECENRNDDAPNFGENFDAVKSSNYDGTLRWKIEAARKIIELFR